MTYIELISLFWERNNENRFTASEVQVYFYLLNEANRRYWKQPFACQTVIVCASLGMDKSTLIRARERLSERGLIAYTKGKQGSRAPTYKVCHATACATAITTDDATAHATASATLIKDKDKDINSSSSRAKKEVEGLPLEELETKLTQDTAWQQQVMATLNKSAATPIDKARLEKLLAQFFAEQRIKNAAKREESDFRSHAYNWMRIQVNKNIKEKTNEKNTAVDYSRPFEVSNVSVEAYEGGFHVPLQ